MTGSESIKLHESWLTYLKDEFSQPYMKELRAFLKAEKSAGKTIYPAGHQIFNALNTTPLGKVSVVILGQDPYHGTGQAHGLSFSVPHGVRIPPSLQNIFKELHRDLSLPFPQHGNLESWAEQGVLLLNATLTVEHANAGSHQKKGWEKFTDKIIQMIDEQTEKTVFLLWGSYAQKKGKVIDSNRHLVLKTVHPSPLSAHRGFIGCDHFSMTNEYLKQHQKTPIDWSLL